MSSPQPGYTSHFGIGNIPFGVASTASRLHPSCVSRFQDSVLFLDKFDAVFKDIDELPQGVFSRTSLNAFTALPRSVHQAVRQRLQALIREDESLRSLPAGSVEKVDVVTMHLPVEVGDFTDFSLSADHVQNASEAMTGKRSAPPSFYHQPVGYAGRCSSLDISGTPVERPIGQYWEGKPGESRIVFGPCKKMDFELELGAIIGKPLPRRERVTASQADKHIFGYVLVNDWSARDIQALEMNPLGPLNGKNAGTTVSPWVVTQDAVNNFRAASPPRLHDVAPYLRDSGNNALSIELQVIVTAPGSEASEGAVSCKSNVSWMYWTLAQCLAHQAIGGCGLRTGDLLATGTVSGQGDGEHGCLLEHMRVGQTPPRAYLEDGETVTLTGYCGEGVGFGECTAVLLPARLLNN
ncbi:hypothetical protein BAUCODRAFT_63654 [Baudoinia panamericana UAMH 10762]|uniref:Fumarylacetoacetase n=1 Tax=Baudoinia panamericana (strain UAMH 10762) TaxID=717646 RepID=M2LXW9_BAUPA|nr:uncharacterized protein BAUCODRAFT_63654 [Baudoinia panamericana UAMH 10762]EMC99527.1 hypothetical protein BAUCODRAFT_63654 [Baudoinia panamericana UAMH 10762]